MLEVMTVVEGSIALPVHHFADVCVVGTASFQILVAGCREITRLFVVEYTVQDHGGDGCGIYENYSC